MSWLFGPKRVPRPASNPTSFPTSFPTSVPASVAASVATAPTAATTTPWSLDNYINEHQVERALDLAKARQLADELLDRANKYEKDDGPVNSHMLDMTLNEVGRLSSLVQLRKNLFKNFLDQYLTNKQLTLTPLQKQKIEGNVPFIKKLETDMKFALEKAHRLSFKRLSALMDRLISKYEVAMEQYKANPTYGLDPTLSRLQLYINKNLADMRDLYTQEDQIKEAEDKLSALQAKHKEFRQSVPKQEVSKNEKLRQEGRVYQSILNNEWNALTANVPTNGPANGPANKPVANLTPSQRESKLLENVLNNAQKEIVPPVRNSLFKKNTPPVNPANYFNRLMKNQKEKAAKVEQNWTRRMQNMKNKSAKASMNWNSFMKMTPQQRIAHQAIKRAEEVERMKQQAEERIQRMRNLEARIEGRKTSNNPFLPRPIPLPIPIPIAAPNTVQTQTNILNKAIANSSKIRVSTPTTIFGSLNDPTNITTPLSVDPPVTSFSLNDPVSTVNPVLSGCGSSPIQINQMLESIEDGAKAAGKTLSQYLQEDLNVPDTEAPTLYDAVEALDALAAVEANNQSGGRKYRNRKSRKNKRNRNRKNKSRRN